MKLGVFDSGLGGLVIARAIRQALPGHDIVYLGDTARVPYGGRPGDEIMRFTTEAVDHLFREQNCRLVIMACNTASALTLRGLQHYYLPEHFPDRRILGVVVPTLEAALEQGHSRIGLLATQATVKSDVFRAELEKIRPGTRIFQQAAPRLVPAIESGSDHLYEQLIREYLAPLLEQNIDCLVLGCTHYTFLKDLIQREAGTGVHVMSQDELIPLKLADYFQRHPATDSAIAKGGALDILVTKITPAYIRNAQQTFAGLPVKEVSLNEVAATYDQPAGRPNLRLGRNAG